MNIFDLDRLAKDSDGEYVLGLKDLNTHAVYIVYGFLRPGEAGRRIFPGKGHEEIFCVTKGEVIVENKGAASQLKMKSGEALHLREDDEYYLKNDSSETVYYVLAGGHPPIRHT